VNSLSIGVFRSPSIQRQRSEDLGGPIHEVAPQIFCWGLKGVYTSSQFLVWDKERSFTGRLKKVFIFIFLW